MRLGASLAPGQSLEAKVDRPTTATFGNGEFISFDLSTVSQPVNLQYQPGSQSIAQWMETNIAVNPNGGWFATESDKRLEFRYDIALQRPTSPIDTRLHKVQAQFFAAASYGPLQVTLLPWTNAVYRAKFDHILKVENEPLYGIASDWDRGLALGASFHRSTLVERGLTCDTCNNERWERMWAQVFKDYSPDGKYSLWRDGKSKVIRDASKYEPR